MVSVGGEGEGDAAGTGAEFEDACGLMRGGDLTPHFHIFAEGGEVEVVEGRDGLEGAFELVGGPGEGVVGHVRSPLSSGYQRPVGMGALTA